MRNRLALLLALAGAAAGLPSEALAQQPAPDPQDPRIDQRIQVPRPDRSEEEELEALLTGEDDILLMQRRRFFALTGGAGFTWTNNAALSPDDADPDFFATAEAGLRFATRLGNVVDVYAEGGVSTARYLDQTELDYVALYGGVGARVAVLGFDVDANYAPVIVWDGDWDQRQLTQHRFTGTIGRGFRVGRGVVRIQVGGERILADPEPFENSAATASLSGAVQLRPNVTLIGAVRGARRWYDNYFEGLLGVERKDWTAEASGSLVLQLHRAVSLDIRGSYTRNWSTSDVSRYKVGTAGVMIRASFRF